MKVTTTKRCPVIPVGYTILVKIEPVKREHEVKGTDVRLVLATDEKLERYAEQRGELIAHGPLAWRDTLKRDGISVGEPWAQVGDKILFARNAGRFLPGEEWKDYVLMQDTDVVAVLREELR